MPVNRDELRKPREHITPSAINANAIHYSKQRELRIDYAPVKKERETRRDSRGSHASHTSSVLQGYGCKCPPTLKHFARYMWILILLIYIFVMPYLISKLYIKVTLSNTKLATMEGILTKHIKARTISPRQVELSERQVSPHNPFSDKNHEYKLASKARERILKRMEVLEKRIKGLTKLESKICFSSQPFSNEKVNARNANASTNCSEGPVGPTGHPGPPGNPGNNGMAGPQGLVGSKGVNGARGIKGSQGIPGRNGSCQCRLDKAIRSVGAVYTRWGRSECPESQKSLLVYNGFIGGSHHNHIGGGSNFLCMPKFPAYSNKSQPSSTRDRSFIYPVEYEIYRGIFETKISGRSLSYYDAICAVCRVKGRGSILMIPGLGSCPNGWTKEYNGYLMAPKKELHRGEYICVDERPVLDASTQGTNGKAGYLNFVDTNCDALKCPPYQRDLELPCVVCSY